MCQLSVEFQKFVVSSWPTVDADREWKFSLDEDHKVLVFCSNGDSHEVALPKDVALVRCEKSGKTKYVFVGFSSEGWLKIRTGVFEGQLRTIVLRGEDEVFSQIKNAGWLSIATINIEPSELAKRIAGKFNLGAQLENMRWQELVSYAAKNGVKAFAKGRNRQSLIQDLLVLEKEA